MQTSMIQVNEYFNCHLKRKTWQQLAEEEQTAAVNTAEMDIMLALGCETLDCGDLLIFCAICEQALFLADKSAPDNLKSESIEGIGKREYFENKSATGSTSVQLSPRSELFLSRLPGYASNRISRG